jgi:hypothetical protein
LHQLHVTPNETVWVIFGPLLGASLAFLCCWLYLGGALDDVRANRSYLAVYLPQRAGTRVAAVASLWWVWTGAHRQLNDPSISRMVYLTRGALLLTVAMWVLLFSVPPDYAERLSAALNRNGF